MSEHEDIEVEREPGSHVVTVEVRRPPANYFDVDLIRRLADVFTELDEDPACRAIVLCSEGRHFCAGRDFGHPRGPGDTAEHLYAHATRLVATGTPWIAAIQGAAVGGGLGLAMVADFRVAEPNARFAANFARIGIHQGFGLSVTLPAAIGGQHAADLLLTGRWVDAHEAAAIGLVDRLTPDGQQRRVAREMAQAIAASAPLAVRSIRAGLRGDIAARFRSATEREAEEQLRLRATDDHREGVAALRQRREPEFRGR